MGNYWFTVMEKNEFETNNSILKETIDFCSTSKGSDMLFVEILAGRGTNSSYVQSSHAFPGNILYFAAKYLKNRKPCAMAVKIF